VANCDLHACLASSVSESCIVDSNEVTVLNDDPSTTITMATSAVRACRASAGTGWSVPRWVWAGGVEEDKVGQRALGDAPELAGATEAGSGAGGHSQGLFDAQGVVAAGDVTMHQRGMIARAAAAASLADRLPGTS